MSIYLPRLDAQSSPSTLRGGLVNRLKTISHYLVTAFLFCERKFRMLHRGNQNKGVPGPSENNQEFQVGCLVLVHRWRHWFLYLRNNELNGGDWPLGTALSSSPGHCCPCLSKLDPAVLTRTGRWVVVRGGSGVGGTYHHWATGSSPPPQTMSCGTRYPPSSLSASYPSY